MNVPINIDINAAVTLYYSRHEITAKDIETIFKCGKTTAQGLKRMARDEQDKAQIPFYNAHAVNVENAYKVWGLDIKKLERAQNHPKIRLGAGE